MRVLLIVLLLTFCVNASFFERFNKNVKDVYAKIEKKVQTAILAVLPKLDTIRAKLKQKLTSTNEKLAKLKKIFEKIGNFTRDRVLKKGDSITQVNEMSGIDELLFQSDILLTQKQADAIIKDIENRNDISRSKRQAYNVKNHPETLWPDRRLYYYFHANATEKIKRLFEKAAQLWKENTCIDFSESLTAEYKVRVTVGTGCWSNVGRVIYEDEEFEQQVSLGEGCEHLGTAAHEIGHALGFFHTHIRYDREEYVIYIQENVEVNRTIEFEVLSSDMTDSYDIPYDYGSVMHYGATSFSPDKKLTIVPFPDIFYINTLGSHFISFFDKLAMNIHYGCIDNCKQNPCKRGGFPNPRNCSKCICPSGYGGDLCDKRPDFGCGKTHQANASVKHIIERKRAKNAEEEEIINEDFTICYYWIESPEETKIRIRILGMSGGYDVDGCTYWGVEIKAQSDQRTTGKRFCSPRDKGVTITSSSNLVPIITYRRIYQYAFVLEYRMIEPTLSSTARTPAETSPSPLPTLSSTTVEKPLPTSSPVETPPSTSSPTEVPLSTSSPDETTRLTKHVTTPSTPRVTSTAAVATSTEPCVDVYPKLCEFLKKVNFCNKYSVHLKRRMCPKMCNLCQPEVPVSSSTTEVPHPSSITEVPHPSSTTDLPLPTSSPDETARLTKHVATPSTPRVTSTAAATTSTEPCVDVYPERCELLKQVNFCKNRNFSEDLKRSMCRKMCKLC